MTTPRKMADHTLDAVKGWLASDMAALDNSARLSANVTIDPVYAGRVVHRNDDEEYEMGCTGGHMAIFIRNNSDDADASNDGGDDWTSVLPKAQPLLTGLVATGGYEIATTEYDTDQTYHMNDWLRAVASNSNATTGGRLTNQTITIHTNAVCGVVSKLPAANMHKVEVLTFWPVYCPGTTGN